MRKKQKTQKPKLITRLYALVFAAVFLISLVNVLLFSQLLNTLEEEARALNNERVNSTAIKLDAILSEVQSYYVSVMQENVFLTYTGTEPSAYTQHQMFSAARNTFSMCEYIHSWTIFLQDSSLVISSNAVHDSDYYFRQLCKSESYTQEFWQEQFALRFTRLFYPEAAYFIVDSNRSVKVNAADLVPVAMKSYWKQNTMTVLLLDMDAICREIGAYFQEGFCLFSGDGTLIYSSDDMPLINAIPDAGKFESEDGGVSVFRADIVESGLQCIKLIPESQAMDLVRNSKNLFIVVTVLSLIVSSGFILLSVRRTLHPVSSMLNLLQQHTSLENSGDIQEAHNVLQQVFQQREEQARTLAQQDTVLSGYFLRSQLKSIYVDVKQPEEDTGTAYIIYIQIQYKEDACACFSMPRAKLENILQQMLSGELNRYFGTTLIFQIEPGKFAAKVTLADGNTRISNCMEQFMKRLEQEREFAYFTVVQSEALRPADDLAKIYATVLEAAGQAQVCERSQLITLSDLPQESSFYFSKQDEQQLFTYVSAGLAEPAESLAADILRNNLQQGITYAQMESLCISIVNTVAYAMAVQVPSREKTAIGSVYSTLTAKCSTAQDYRDAVLSFIRTAVCSEKSGEKQDALLIKVQQYLQENYRREFTGEEMADALKVSRSYLSSYYKNKTGMNLSDSIQLYRIQRAVELMKNPDIKISQIGPMVGISSGNTFLRQFKKYTGMSPKEYRTKSK